MAGDRPQEIPERTTAVGALRKSATGMLSSVGISDASRSVDWILSHVLGCARAQLIGYPDKTVTSDQVHRFDQLLARRVRGEPLQYILGIAEFYGLEMSVTPAVLVPRPETELLVDVALDLIKDLERPTILDAGTGSGCIAVAIGHSRRDAVISGIDVSEAALRVARQNAKRHGVEVRFELADLSDQNLMFGSSARFDLIVSNPPYIHQSELASLDNEVVDFEPRIALVSGDDPLRFYRLLVTLCDLVLRPGGSLVVEIHEDRAEQVSELFSSAGFGCTEVRLDLSGKERLVVGSSRDIELRGNKPCSQSRW